MHKFMKAAGIRSEQEFYNKYPTQEAFFAAHSHMAEGGYVGNGVLPQIMPGMYPGNTPTLMNQDARVPMDIDVPAYANGGFYQRPGYFYDGNSMVKAKGSGTYDNGVYFQQGGYPHPLDQSFDNFERGGYPHPLDMSFDEFKKGGIHINPDNKGKFNALKKKTGKSTEELIHSSNPLTRKRAVFAQNAKKWKHEEGGYANPFNPIHQYMATGGYSNPWGSTNTNSAEIMQEINAPVQNAQQDLTMMDDYNHQQYKNQAVSPQYATNDQPVEVSPQSDMYSTEDTEEQQVPPKQRRNGVANWGSAILGVGTGILGTASILNDKFNNQKVQQRWQRDQGMTDNGPRYINTMGKGTYSQTGDLPYNNQSQSPNIRTMERGGYTKNQVVDLSQSEIDVLIRQGYKLQVVK